MIARERLYLNKDKTKIVKEGSKESATLLAGAGCEIPKEYQSMVPPETKEAPSRENKEAPKVENKSGLTINKARDKK